MNAREYGQIKKNQFISLDRLLTLVLVVLSSFAFASIPFIASLSATNSQQETIVPTEAQLWQELSRSSRDD